MADGNALAHNDPKWPQPIRLLANEHHIPKNEYAYQGE
jgi:hypothetical protein